MRLLLIFLAGAAVFYLQRLLYKRIWDRGLDVRVRFGDAFVYEGQTTEITEEIVNDKGFPLPALEIRFALDRNLSYLQESAENASLSDKNYRRDVFSLFSRQKKIRTFALSCEKRGYYRIDEAELVGYDYFFQKKYYDTRTQHTAIYVYPHLADVRRIRNVCLAITGMRPVRNPLYQDPFAFAGIRSYDRSDPMNRINWKASAKSGEWMVNQFDATTDFSVRCLLDTADDYILTSPHLVEESISIAAALAAELLAGRTDVDILGNGEYLEPAEGLSERTADAAGKPEPRQLEISLRGGSGGLQEMYRRLACIETGHVCCDMAELLAAETDRIRPDCLYVLISKNYDAKMREAAVALAKAGARLLWIRPVDAGETARGTGETVRGTGEAAEGTGEAAAGVSGAGIGDVAGTKAGFRLMDWEVEP